MPYVEDKYKTVLDPCINSLADAVRAVKSRRDLVAVRDLIPPLATAIVREDQGCGYWGAFAGLLNYSSTETLLKVLPTRPKVRYWVMAEVAGLAAELEHLFRTNEAHKLAFHPLSDAAELWFSHTDKTPFGKDHAFGDILVWTLANLAMQASPEHSRSTRRAVAGVFRNIDTEFYRRLGILYEDLKIGENGDVSYKEYADLIRAEMAKKQIGPGGVFLGGSDKGFGV